MLQSLFYLTIALHVSGIIIAHLQEHKTTVTTASGSRYTVLLFVDIVEAEPTLPREKQTTKRCNGYQML